MRKLPLLVLLISFLVLSLQAQVQKGDKIGLQAKQRASRVSTGRCGAYVRQAIQLGLGLKNEGLGITYAKDLGPWLVKVGYSSVGSISSMFKNGDVAIFEGTPKHTSGHSQIYYEGSWYSDFSQNNFYPYADGTKPKYIIYRINK